MGQYYIDKAYLAKFNWHSPMRLQFSDPMMPYSRYFSSFPIPSWSSQHTWHIYFSSSYTGHWARCPNTTYHFSQRVSYPPTQPRFAMRAPLKKESSRLEKEKTEVVAPKESSSQRRGRRKNSIPSQEASMPGSQKSLNKAKPLIQLINR